MIDAGLPGHWRDLTAELGAMGRSLEDIKGVVLTHGDSDHLGFAERLRSDHGVPVYVHSADADRAKGGDKPKVAMGPWRLGATAGFFAYALRKNGMRTHYLSEVVEVADGDILPLPGSPKVISMPGHSPGSIALHVPAVDAVFVGDALTTRHVLTGHRGCSRLRSPTSRRSRWSPLIGWRVWMPRGCCPATAGHGRAGRRMWPRRCEPLTSVDSAREILGIHVVEEALELVEALVGLLLVLGDVVGHPGVFHHVLGHPHRCGDARRQGDGIRWS